MKQLVTLFLSLFLFTQVNSQSVPSYVPTNGLVGWWGFNGDAQDGTGNGNHGMVNGATLTTDRFGNQNGAYSFDGINDFIIVPSSNVFNSNDLSISMWVSSSKLQRQIALIRLTYSNASNEHFGIAFNDLNQFGVEIAAKYNNNNCIAGHGWQKNEKVQNIMDNNFHHVLGTISGNALKIYIDGILSQILTTPFQQTSSCWNGDIQIGRNWSSYQDFFDGKLDDIGIWNRALTPQEITGLFQAECPTITSQPQNLSTSPSRNVTFSLSSSDSNSTYQWESNTGFGFQPLFNAGQYSGVNTSSLTVSNTSMQNNNQLFRCIVSSNNCGRDTSDMVTLSVNTSSSTTNIPKRFNYQSVIRDTSGVLVTNRTIGLKVTLSRGPHLGDLYSETHQLTSNSNGLITSSIGGGIPVLGSMDSIDWSLGDVYIKTEVDVNGGTNYVVLNTNQLLSVPYSLYSLNSGNSVPGPVGPQGPQGIQGMPGNDGIPGPQGPQGSFPPGTQVGQMNYWDGTNWVTLSPNNTGQYLVLCNGVPAWGCTPNVTTTNPSSVSYYSATTGGVVNNDGGSVVTARGVVYDTVPSPNLSDNFTIDGISMSGTFQSNLTNLFSSTTYYVRAYATNSLGTGYGNEVTFVTQTTSLPVVSTNQISDITSNSAISGGNVISDGGLATTRGVVFDTISSPTISGRFTSDGSGVGTYVSTLAGLISGTQYYVRAYATNVIGTSYGNEISFGTQPPPGQPCPGTPTVTDIDGNIYNTVQIGTQCWTQSNLTVSKYRNGDNIPNITDNNQWSQTNTNSTGAWCNYNNDANNGTTYGKLYNWYAVNDSRGLCPTGWHVPTDSEWNVMVKYLDPNADTAAVGWQNTDAANALKSTTGWSSQGTGVTNSSGFSALPGGDRYPDGSWGAVYYYGLWWSSSDGGSGSAWYRFLHYIYAAVNRTNNYHLLYDPKRHGFSVRCARD